MLTAHYGAFRRAKTTPSRCQELSVGPVYFFGPFLGFFLFAQDKQTWNPLWTQWNLDAPKFVQYNRQKCPICARCVKSLLGKHISPAHPVSRANFVYTVIGCEKTFLTKNARTRHEVKDHGITQPKPFQCNVPGYKLGPFETNGHLLAHMRRCHNAGGGDTRDKAEVGS